jgi:hypothetical protein
MYTFQQLLFEVEDNSSRDLSLYFRYERFFRFSKWFNENLHEHDEMEKKRNNDSSICVVVTSCYILDSVSCYHEFS